VGGLGLETTERIRDERVLLVVDSQASFDWIAWAKGRELEECQPSERARGASGGGERDPRLVRE
jgi:hypothetical protein